MSNKGRPTRVTWGNRLVKLAVAMLAVGGCLAISAGAAGAAEVIYNNTNTVPMTINGSPNTDTFSEGFECCGNKTIGGEIKTAGSAKTIKSIATQVDVFRCQEGVYYFENCHSKPSKKFAQVYRVKVYEVTGTNERGALITSSEVEAKLHFRPTTNTSCPATGEGKGYGPNCDVGGYLQTVKFAHFPYSVLPNNGLAIVEFSTTPEGDLNVGFEESYVEYKNGEYIGQPGSGAPAVGSEPDPTEIFKNGLASGPGYEGAQPVIEIKAKQ